MSGGPATGVLGEEAVWHDVECGAYAADLALWRELAATAAGPVLELGCGTGRVALDLAAGGYDVVGVDASPALIAELRDRALRRGLTVEAHVADVRELALERQFALVCAPMQLIHLLGGRSGRVAMLHGARAHLAPGGALAVAILAEHVDPALEGHPPLPDVREHEGWIYSSQPLDARIGAGEITVRRLRQLVSPAGELREQLDVVTLDALDSAGLQAEAAMCGLALREAVGIAATADHVGSTVLVMEVA